MSTSRFLQPGRLLGSASRSLLKSINLAGRLPLSDLMMLQELMADGRSEKARRATIRNLEALGYTERHNFDKRCTWRLTGLGREALLDAKPTRSKPIPKKPTCERSQTEPECVVEDFPPPLPTRLVRFGRGVVSLPIAPRSVFELGNFSA